MSESKREMILDREEAVAANQDATGKVWTIAPVRGTSMVECRPADYENITNVPDALSGKWTKAEWLQTKITNYCNESWDVADSLTAKSKRKAQASKENKAA